MRIAILASHPVQYYAPLFRELSRRVDLVVYYGHRATREEQGSAGFGVAFDWDVDLLGGYAHEFLQNVAAIPGAGRFSGIDTPEIEDRLRAGRFDGLLIMGWHLKCFLQGMWAAKRMGLPVMVRGDSHLGTPRSRLKSAAKALVYPHFLARFDAALVVGERNHAYWRRYGYPESQIFHSPHSIDNDWFATRATDAARTGLRSRLEIAQDAPVVLFAGKLLPFKRPLDVIDAAAMVGGVQVLVAGAGALAETMRSRAHKLDVQLHELGFCNQSEMPAAYAAADLLVLPSDGRETWGLVVNEALACGKAVIVSDAVGCAPDLQKRIGEGSVFRLGNTRELAQRMRAFVERPPRADLRSRFTEFFSLAKATQGVVTALQHIAPGHRRGL